MQNLRNLSTKDKMIIAKAIADISMDIYKSQNTFILNQIIKQGNHESEFGKFWTETKGMKTVEETLKKKLEELEKLQNEIETLKSLNKDAIYTEAKVTLYSKHTEKADEIAKELLQDLVANLDSKRLNNAASKR